MRGAGWLSQVLLMLAVAGAAGGVSWMFVQDMSAMLIAVAASAPLGAAMLWTQLVRPAPKPSPQSAPKDVSHQADAQSFAQPHATDPPDAADWVVAGPATAADTTGANSAWNDFLPDLMSVLEALAQRAIQDTNESSIALLSQLMSVEEAVTSLNRRQDDALRDLDTIDRIAEDHRDARDRLNTDITAAMASGQEVIQEVTASRTALTGVESSIREMQRELSAISKISKEINILSINATIEASRAGDHGAGFSVIAKNIRQLSDETESVTRRLGPLITGARNDLKGYASQRQGTGDRDVSHILSEQREVLNEVSGKLDSMGGDFARIISGKRTEIIASLSAGADVEAAIRSILSTAQFADIIRQQIESLAGGLTAIRDVSVVGGDTHETLKGLMEQLESSYVMDTQRRAHKAGLEDRATSAAPSGGEDCDSEPSLELF